jgi:hypothetical protein
MKAASRICASRRAAWAVASLVVILTLLAQSARLAEPDIAYFVYSAGRLLDGAKLYRDVVDMNPPAILALNVPIVWLSRLTRLPDLLVYRLVAFALVGGALLFVRRVLGRYVLVDRPAERRYVLLWLCLILFPLARDDFGQREHLVLALLLPYVAVALARLGGKRVALSDALAAGLLAGIALALKPPFVLAWLAVEVWYRWRGYAERWRLTPEVAGTVGVSVAYFAAVLTFTPEYPRLVGLLGGAFMTYLRSTPLTMLTTPGALLIGFALLAALATRGSGRDANAQAIIVAAMLGSFLAGVAQQKDLRYHFYPAFGLATLALAILAARSVPEARRSARAYRLVATWLVAAIALVVLGGAAVGALGGNGDERRRRAEFREFVETVKARAGAEPVGMLSYQMGSAFPLVNYAGLGLASRFACLWILPASYWDALTGERPIRYHLPAEMRPPERMLNQAVREDLLAARPRVLLVLRPFPDEPPYGFRRLNYIAYFGRDPPLAEFFAGYQWVSTEGAYDLYERVEPGAARTGPPPSAAVPPLPSHWPRRPSFDPELALGATIFIVLAIGSLGRRRLAASWLPPSAL